MQENPSLKACAPALMAVGVFSFFANILMLTVPLYMLQLFDRVLSSRSGETLAMLTIVAVGALVVLAILEAVRSRIMIRVGDWIARRLGPPLLSHSVESAVLTNRRGDVQGIRDLTTVRAFLGGSGVFHLLDAPWVPIYVFVIFLLHPWLGLIAALGAFALFALAVVNEVATKKPFNRASGLSMKLFGRVSANVRNADVIEAMGMLPHLRTAWAAENEKVLRLHRQAADRAGLIGAATRFMRLALQIAMLAAGVYLAVRGEITPGVMIAAAIILSRALAPVEQMIGTWKGFVGARDAYRRIQGALASSHVMRGETDLPVPAGRLDVEELTVFPPGAERPVLRDVSFRLDPGECLGVVGPSAAGKSSLARALVGIWAARGGTVRLDGADVFVWNREDLGRFVGYLPQEIELFDGSIKSNIARMGPPDDEAVIAAAAMAGVHDMVLRLPLGYDTEIGDGGIALSGGQRQRIGLARAFYGEPRLLVLDEPGASLDAEGNTALLAALSRAQSVGMTTIVVTHHPNTLATADKILVLNDGRVALFGRREQAMARLFPNRPAEVKGPRPAATALREAGS